MGPAIPYKWMSFSSEQMYTRQPIVQEFTQAFEPKLDAFVQFTKSSFRPPTADVRCWKTILIIVYGMVARSMYMKNQPTQDCTLPSHTDKFRKQRPISMHKTRWNGKKLHHHKIFGYFS